MAAVESHTISALVEDRPGVLARVSGLFRRRGFNISSLTVGHSEVAHLSRMTFVVEGDDWVVEQVTKQLYKLVDVVRVNELSEEALVSRELALIRVKATAESRAEIMQIVDIFRDNIVDVGPESVVIEVTGDEEKVDAILKLLKPFGIKEVMRTGRVAMERATAPARSASTQTYATDESAPDTEVVP